MSTIVLQARYHDMGVEVIGSNLEEAKDWFWEDISCRIEDRCDDWREQMTEDFLPKDGNIELQRIYDELYACEDVGDLEDFMSEYEDDYGSDMWGRLREKY